MKKILKDVVLLTLAVVYFWYVVKYNSYVSNQVILSFELWIKKVIPSVLPTLIIVDLIYISNIPYYCFKYLHIDFIYVLSIIGGSPSNAVMVSKYDKDRTKLLAVTKNISLIFLYNSLSKIFKRKIVIILILANILSNIVMICFLKPKVNVRKNDNGSVLVIFNNFRKYMWTLIAILGMLLFFNTLPVFLIKGTVIKSFVLSFLEITTFFDYISMIDISLKLKLLFSLLAISSCGLCIEGQIKSILNDTSINYKYYFFYRLWHLFLLMLISYVLIIIL